MNIAATFNAEELDPIAHEIWDMKYRFKQLDGTPVDEDVDETWWRVANALAQAEKPEVRSQWEERFHHVMSSYRFLPAGRIIAGAGTDRNVTLFNCYVMGCIDDSMPGIFEALKEAALTMQQGGGIGMDFSTIRPAGAPVLGVGSDASGPLSFMDCWDSMCRTIMSAGTRRGAMMGVMRCDHPDIKEFVEAKRDPKRFRNFNLSVLVTDEFMDAVKNDEQWFLQFDDEVHDVIEARDLWDRIMQATYDVAEPGVIFIDRINQDNNLNYCETIYATNPCGEEPLPPYGACLLGSINLPRFVSMPFTEFASIDLAALDSVVKTAIRMLDNVIDVSNYPLVQQEREAKAKRRIGLGITGLADALAMMQLRYGSDEAASQASDWMEWISRSAYEASLELAEEKGPFPKWTMEYGENGFASNMLDEIKARYNLHGIRNSHLISIAPTGTISLFAGNVSGGIEPIFAYEADRKVLLHDGTRETHKVVDYAVRLWRSLNGETPLPDYFVTAQDLKPIHHLRMQAALQPYVDSSISKTINCPKDISFDAFKAVYMMAYDQGCKGCTTYRPNDVTGSVLSVDDPEQKIVPLDQLAPRADVLPGQTYKLKMGNEHALYVTINDIEEGGQRRPYEIFVNSKNMEHYAWTVALTRMISAVFRRAGDVSFVVEELKAVFDPRGGHWHRGKYVPSVVAGIGGIVEQHMHNLGLIDQEIARPPEVESKSVSVSDLHSQCPQCGQLSVVKREGCEQCLECSYNKCG
jgi:ribonucleoside-diphosphate reductase alpha chain